MCTDTKTDQQLTDIAAATLRQHHIRPGPLFLISRTPAHTPTVCFRADGHGHPITVNIDRDSEEVHLQTLLDSAPWLSAEQRASLQAAIDEQLQTLLSTADT